MISLTVFILTLILVGTLLGALKKSTYYDGTGRFRAAGLLKMLGALLVALAVAINPVNVERIDAGHVGIKLSNVGDNRGVGKTEYVTG